jgi:hypothetical protein
MAKADFRKRVERGKVLSDAGFVPISNGNIPWRRKVFPIPNGMIRLRNRTIPRRRRTILFPDGMKLRPRRMIPFPDRMKLRPRRMIPFPDRKTLRRYRMVPLRDRVILSENRTFPLGIKTFPQCPKPEKTNPRGAESFCAAQNRRFIEPEGSGKTALLRDAGVPRWEVLRAKTGGGGGFEPYA